MDRRWNVMFDMFEPNEEIYLELIVYAKDKQEAEIIAKQKLKVKGINFDNKEPQITSF